MGFFRRRESPSEVPPAVEGPADPTFPMHTVADASAVRRMTAQRFAEAGIEVTIDDDVLVGADGYRYGLYNLMAGCGQQDRRTWPELIATHVGSMSASRHEPTVAELSPEQLAAQIRTRLMPTDSLHAGPITLTGYARRLNEDLAVVLCIDRPQSISYLNEDDVARLCADHATLDALFRRAQRNTDAEPVDDVEHYRHLSVVSGDSFFVASQAANFAGLLGRSLGVDAPHGVVFAVPHRSMVVMYVLAAAESPDVLLSNISALTAVAAQQESTAPGGLSPHAYYWYRDTVTRIATVDPGDNSVHIDPGPELWDVINRLTGQS